jgi:HSP20 family molecular chaperone IbpA
LIGTNKTEKEQKKKHMALRLYNFLSPDNFFEEDSGPFMTFGDRGRRMPNMQSVMPNQTKVEERNGSTVLSIDMHNFKDQEIHISSEGGYIKIDAEKKEDKEEKNGYKFHSRQTFHQAFKLPPGATEDKVHAHLKDGIVEITIEGVPLVKASAEPKKIDIVRK